MSFMTLWSRTTRNVWINSKGVIDKGSMRAGGPTMTIDTFDICKIVRTTTPYGVGGVTTLNVTKATEFCSIISA
jgi:hypothetical protein